MFLLIETSTERAMVAFVQGEEPLFHAELPFGYQHSRHLVSLVDRGLKALQLTPQELKAVVVGVGPGSYTGMRVGAMTAKMLSFAAGVPLIGICTLHTFVPQRQQGPFATLIDAKIGGVYFSQGNSAPLLLPVEALSTHLRETALIVTPHAAPLQAKFAAHL